MQCNIDQRGKLARILVGSLLEAAGLLIIVFVWTGTITGDWGWIVGGALFFGGLFVLFEGLAGWCALRAIGIRTPV